MKWDSSRIQHCRFASVSLALTEAADVLDVRWDQKWEWFHGSLTANWSFGLQTADVSLCCASLFKLASPQPLWHHKKSQQRHVLKQILPVWVLLHETPLGTSSSGPTKLTFKNVLPSMVVCVSKKPTHWSAFFLLLHTGFLTCYNASSK